MPNLNILQQFEYMAQSDALYIAITGKVNLMFLASLFNIVLNKVGESNGKWYSIG